MCLFDRSASYPSKRISWRDAAARFLHDLATNGVPMSLQNLKAYCDLAARIELPSQTHASEKVQSPFRLPRRVAPAPAPV